MKKLIIITAALLALSACSAQESSSLAPEQTTKAAAAESTDPESSDDGISSDNSSKAEPETVRLTAEVVVLSEDSITVSTDGEEHTLDLSECEFRQDVNEREFPGITERIINNPFGIKTKVNLKCDTTLTKAYYCDAVSPNGSGSGAFTDTDRPEGEAYIGGKSLFGSGSRSVYSFTYIEETESGEYSGEGKIDLESSDIFFAPEFGEGDSFSAFCYKFSEGNCFLALDTYLLETDAEEKKDENGKVVFISRGYSAPDAGKVFYGHVTGESDDKVTVELYNGVVCTLTPSVTVSCRSFSAGDPVRARFTEQEDYADSPEQTDFDFAVIEKAGDLSAEVASIVDERVYAAIGENDIMIIPEELIDSETSEPITGRVGYTSVFVAFDDIKYAEEIGATQVYYVSTAKLGR